MTESLSEFLLARIAEDEAVAGLALSVIPSGEGWYRVAQAAVVDPEFAESFGFAYQHIARHDPARVLAECEAKRRIVGLHALTVGRVSMPPFDVTTGKPNEPEYDVTCDVCGWASADPSSGCETLQLLALPYADHPDYRQEWRP